MRIDFDSAWKDTTGVYFAALLELFEPQSPPRACDHEPVSFLDQEMQELAQVLGDEGGDEAAVNTGDGGAEAAGSESQPSRSRRTGGGRGGRRDSVWTSSCWCRCRWGRGLRVKVRG